MAETESDRKKKLRWRLVGSAAAMVAIAAVSLGAYFLDEQRRQEQVEDELGMLSAEAESLEYDEEMDAALEARTRAIELMPSNAWSYVYRGGTYMLFGQYDAALRDFDKALELRPDFAWAHSRRGNTYRLSGRYDEALRDFTKAIELEPDLAEAYHNRGTLYVENLNLYDEALRDFTKAIELDSDFVSADVVSAYVMRGNTYKILKRSQEALRDYNKALEMKPDSAEAYGARGAFYAENLNLYDEALRDLDKALELNWNLVSAYVARGNTYKILERYQEALQDYERAWWSGPTNESLSKSVAEICGKIDCE